MIVPGSPYPAGWARQLVADGRPRAVRMGGMSLALFRDAAGVPRAVADACPHRGFPLSEGRVVGGELECAYHGWRFDGRGTCVAVPGRVTSPDGARGAPPCVATHPARDAHGVTWVGSTAGEGVLHVPDVTTVAGRGALSFRWTLVLDGALADVAENILDVPHTAFLHGGLFRRPGRGAEIEARAARTADRMEVEYVGEPVPTGLLGRVLAPRGGVVRHVDRFVMPCVAQVDYGLGDRMRLLATTFLRPEGPSRTRAFHVISLAPRSLAMAALPLFAPLAGHVLRQDARALRLQSENLARFPDARFGSTELDLVGPHVRQMLERAARGSSPPPDAAWTVRLAP